MAPSMPETGDDDQIVAAIRAMRSARADGSLPLSRETHVGFFTPRNRPPPPPTSSPELRPARTVTTLRNATAPARLSTKRVPTDKAPSSASVPSFWSKPAAPSRPFWAVAESSEEPATPASVARKDSLPKRASMSLLRTDSDLSQCLTPLRCNSEQNLANLFRAGDLHPL